MRAVMTGANDLLSTPDVAEEPAVALRAKVDPVQHQAAQVAPSPPRSNHAGPSMDHIGDGSQSSHQGQKHGLAIRAHSGEAGRGGNGRTMLEPTDSSLDDGESPLFMAHRPRRSFEAADKSSPPLTTTAVPQRQKARSRQSAPPSTAALWTSQLSHVAFPGRRPAPSPQSSDTATLSTHARSESLPGRPDLSPLRIPPSPATPPRSRASSRDASPAFGRSTSATRKRISPSPTLRNTFRLPFLPSIPASPLPPILSPGLTRSASSPPILPALPISLPLAPELALTPPTATFEGPKEGARWPTSRSRTGDTDISPSDSSAKAQYRPTTSASAPNLSIYAAAAAAEDDSAGESYFPTPVTTAASTPGIAEANLCFAPISTSSAPISAVDEPESLSHDEELLVTDATHEDLAAQETTAQAALDNNRYHALLELVETERGYLEHLRILVKVYFQTLPFLTILTLHEVQAIVRNAEQLLDLHERITERIEQVEADLSWKRHDTLSGRDGGPEQARKTRTAAARIARVFAEQLPDFALYSEFCSRHAEALDIVRIVAARPEWEAYERQCASRAVPDSSEITPTAARGNSSVFFAEVSPPSSSATSHSSTPTPPATLSATTRPGLTSSPSTTFSRSAKLRFSDYAIAPVQRITRYPMLLGQLGKYLQGTSEHETVRIVCEGFKVTAQAVDAAKREREGELRTRIVASRIEFNTPLVGGAFCDLLGPTLLVGALHVVHYNSSSGSASTAAYNSDPWAPQAAMPSSPISSAAEVVRVKYFGCFLYRTHLVMAKIKKRATYEPREWLPLRLFDIQSSEEGQGLLSHSISISFREHRFELGAICAGEKVVWLSRLLKAQAEARQAWDEQQLDEHGQSTLFDDSLVSSIPILASTDQKRKAHSRSASSASVASLALLAPPVSTDGPRLSHDEPVPPIPREYSAGLDQQLPDTTPPTSVPSSQPSSPPGGSALALVSSPQLHSRSRFSSTASSLLLGRTPSSQRAAVDLRLADVFSAECQAARAQAARDAEIEATAAILAGKRSRTISGPKRSATALPSTSSSFGGGPGSTSSALRNLNAVNSLRDGRRMSAAEMTSGVDRSDFDGALGLDLGILRDPAVQTAGLELLGMTPAASLERERSHKWSTAIRKVHRAGSSGSATMVPVKTRPPLPEIDTALAQAISRSGSRRAHSSYGAPLSAGGTWSRRGVKDRDRLGGLGGQLRRVASHSSLDADTSSGRLLRDPSTAALTTVAGTVVVAAAPTTSLPLAAVPAVAAEVERNNSVSSTSSSSAGAQSSSSHAHSLQALETPPSSIPPSPNLPKTDLPESHVYDFGANQGAWARFQPQGASQRPRWSTAMSDGVTGIFRLARRKSTLGLVPPATLRSSPNESEESLTARSPTTTATPSDVGGPKLQRRASATISSLFTVKRRNHSSPALYGEHERVPTSSTARASSPHLPLDYASSGAETVRDHKSTIATTENVAPASTADATVRAQTPSPQKKVSIGRATSLIRSRSRLLFTAHNGMTPMS
ncbi:hypothetical protein JCM10908_002929 [Rhodotorula pacifica]|uniref:uncharacterized protein n=1 Tax=Rhodotorula pacifica TaxID=1495444 RepID=UPI003171BD3B